MRPMSAHLTGRIGRVLFAIAVAVTATVSSAQHARALIEIDITKGRVEPMPIALPNFIGNGQDQKFGADITLA